MIICCLKFPVNHLICKQRFPRAHESQWSCYHFDVTITFDEDHIHAFMPSCMGEKFLEKLPFISFLLVCQSTDNYSEWNSGVGTKWECWSSAFHSCQACFYFYFFIYEALIFGCCWVEISLKNLKCRRACPSYLIIVHYSWQDINRFF